MYIVMILHFNSSTHKFPGIQNNINKIFSILFRKGYLLSPQKAHVSLMALLALLLSFLRTKVICLFSLDEAHQPQSINL